MPPTAMDIDAPDAWGVAACRRKAKCWLSLDSMMNYLPDQPRFEEFSTVAAQELNAMQTLGQLQHTNPGFAAGLYGLDAAEEQIGSWIINRLLEEKHVCLPQRPQHQTHLRGGAARLIFGSKPARAEQYSLFGKRLHHSGSAALRRWMALTHWLRSIKIPRGRLIPPTASSI